MKKKLIYISIALNIIFTAQIGYMCWKVFVPASDAELDAFEAKMRSEAIQAKKDLCDKNEGSHVLAQ